MNSYWNSFCPRFFFVFTGLALLIAASPIRSADAAEQTRKKKSADQKSKIEQNPKSPAPISLGTPLPSSHGLATDEESKLLWRDGKKAYEDGSYLEATQLLQRLVDRYPGAEGTIRARYLLALSYVETDQPRLAIPLLKDWLGANRTTPDTVAGRVALARAYLKNNQPQEALLAVSQVIDLEDKPIIAGPASANGTTSNLESGSPAGAPASETITLPGDSLTEALVVKGQTLIRLHELERAARTLSAAKRTLTEFSGPIAQGETAYLDLELGLLECAKLPVRSTGQSQVARSVIEPVSKPVAKMDESQAQDQLKRRGACLTEQLVTFLKIARSGDFRSAESGAKKLASGFEGYWDSVNSPPLPRQKGKNATQQRKYLAELRDLLAGDFRSATDLSIQLCNDALNQSEKSAPKTGLPPETQPAVKELMLEFQKLRMKARK